MKVEANDGQAGPRSEGARERALPGPRQPSHDDASAYRDGGISHRRQCPSSAVTRVIFRGLSVSIEARVYAVYD